MNKEREFNGLKPVIETDGTITILKSEYKELLIIKGSSKEVIGFESFFLNKLKEFKYIPKETFEGKTECFTLKSKNKIYEHFKQY